LRTVPFAVGSITIARIYCPPPKASPAMPLNARYSVAVQYDMPTRQVLLP
jgi:hypothetical protein